MMLNYPKVWFLFDENKQYTGVCISPYPPKGEPYAVEGDAALLFRAPKLVDGRVVSGIIPQKE